MSDITGLNNEIIINDLEILMRGEYIFESFLNGNFTNDRVVVVGIDSNKKFTEKRLQEIYDYYEEKFNITIIVIDLNHKVYR